MLDAHTEAGFVVGVPFASPGLYDFGQHGGMTARWVSAALNQTIVWLHGLRLKPWVCSEAAQELPACLPQVTVATIAYSPTFKASLLCPFICECAHKCDSLMRTPLCWHVCMYPAAGCMSWAQ
jgi:hypothetical protein